jgi:AraC-like DNA-binding protein
MKIIQFTIPVAQDKSIHVQEDNLPHFYEHLHRHHEIQITWVISGEGTLVAGNNMLPFSSGDVFIIGANQPHLFKSDASYFDKHSKKRIHSLNLFFNHKGFITSLLDFPEMRNVKKFVELCLHGFQASEKNAKIIADYMLKVKNNSGGYRLSAFIELLQLMTNLKDWKHLNTESLEYAISDSEGLRMNDIYQYTMNNYTEDISLEKISAVAYLTPQSFCRYFKKHTQKTYTNFVNELRINEACKKLTSKDFDSISTIAYQMGFNNVVTFNRVFKGIMKKSPREFMKEYAGKIED